MQLYDAKVRESGLQIELIEPTTKKIAWLRSAILLRNECLEMKKRVLSHPKRLPDSEAKILPKVPTNRWPLSNQKYKIQIAVPTPGIFPQVL